MIGDVPSIIRLHKYRPGGGDWVMFVIFGMMGVFAIWCSHVPGIAEIPGLMLWISGVTLIGLTGLPISGLLWEDDRHNTYIFPNRIKYLFEKN
jgi:hypothetical protein